MSDWCSDLLGDLADFRKGVKVDVYDVDAPGTVPYLGASAIDTGEASRFAQERGAVLASVTDVLMLWDGERSGLVGGGQSGVVASTVARLRPRSSIDSNYLRHALQHQFAWIQAQRTGTGVPHVPKDLGSRMSLAHPVDRVEQEQVVRILECSDEHIRTTAQMIAKLRLAKQGQLEDFFSDLPTSDSQPLSDLVTADM